MNESAKILVVDDDPNIVSLLKLYLTREQYTVLTASNGGEGLSLFQLESPSLVLLDVMMPGMDGWDVCRSIRKTSSLPIIMLTAKDDTIDKVLGLELGADDYIVKPFEPKELIARIKAVLRRTQPKDAPSSALHYAQLVVDMEQFVVTYRGKALDLPPKEMELLHFLASNPNRVFTREQLLNQVWGFDYYGDSRTVDVHVKRLREKFEDCEALGWQIKTVWGVGYKFEVK